MAFKALVLEGNGERQEVFVNPQSVEAVITSMVVTNNTTSTATFIVYVGEDSYLIEKVLPNNKIIVSEKINIPISKSFSILLPENTNVAVSYMTQAIDASGLLSFAQTLVASLDKAAIIDEAPSANSTWTSAKIVEVIQASKVPTVSLDLPVYVNQVVPIRITNYNTYSSYTATSLLGNVAIFGDIIEYTCGSTSYNDVITVTCDTATVDIPIDVVDAPVSGVEWDPVTDTYTRTGAGSENDAHIAIASRMRRCVLDADGVVRYYLHPLDSTKRADGTDADLTGVSGDVMVEIPKFYYKYEAVEGKHHWSCSTEPLEGYTVHPAFIKEGVEVSYRYRNAYNVRDNGTTLISASGLYPTTQLPISQFRSKARSKGQGWSLLDWNLMHAIQVIYLVEFANFNIKDTIGMGRTTLSGGMLEDGSYYVLSGLSNKDGNATANRSDGDSSYETDYMTYRGIEHWYGHLWNFVDGVNVFDRNYYVSNTPSTYTNDKYDGDYSLLVKGGITNGYIKNYNNTAGGFIPSAVGGSQATYVGDYYYQNSASRIVVVGGYVSDGGAAGPFCLHAGYPSTVSSSGITAGLAF